MVFDRYITGHSLCLYSHEHEHEHDAYMYEEILRLKVLEVHCSTS